MSDFWRRMQIESRTRLRGSSFRHGNWARWEENRGRIADSATFECSRCVGQPPPDPGRPVRLRVQVRTGVVLRQEVPRGASGHIDEQRFVDEIAIGASGGYPDQQYSWVQIYSEEPEHLVRFDGTSSVENVNWEREAPSVAGSQFSWAGREWAIDAIDRQSARYSISLPTAGSPNCDTIYDRPTMLRAIQPWMEENPDVRRVSRTTQFHTFLYSMPLLRSERQGVHYSDLRPVASVAWSFDETVERPDRDAPPERRERRYRVHYIHPNGVAPPDMNWVLLHVFHGR